MAGVVVLVVAKVVAAGVAVLEVAVANGFQPHPPTRPILPPNPRTQAAQTDTPRYLSPQQKQLLGITV